MKVEDGNIRSARQDSPNGPDEAPSAAFMSALVTEHFVLQSAASATIGESGTRAAIYLSALSSGLVAIGFASASAATLKILICTVLPIVFLLGWTTVVRLVDTTIENNVARARIQRIRAYYATLATTAHTYFVEDARGESFGVKYTGWSILFTTATVISVINAVLGATIVALVLVLLLGTPTATATSLGAAVGALVMLAALFYQRHRFARSN